MVLSKPVVVSYVSGLAMSALAIRKFGEQAANADARLPKLFVAATSGRKKEKVAVDGRFMKRLWRLLKIVCPGVFTPEFGYASLVAGLLLCRTVCDLWMIARSTAIESSIVRRDAKGFLTNMSKFILSFIPIALVNNGLKYGLMEMSLRFRKRLTQYLYKQYMAKYTYYQVSNTDNRIANVDQLLTTDVEKFCTSVVDLYSNTSKPLLDMCVYSYKLSNTIGMQGPGTILAYLGFSGVLLTWLRRPLGRFTVAEQSIEGEYRFVNSRVIAHAEEISFYNGANRESWVVAHTFDRLVEHIRRSQQFRYSLGIIDSLVGKYFATCVGFYVISRPAFGGAQSTMQAGSMADYNTSARMLINLSGAVGRLVLAGREMTRLAGFTSRVTELMQVLEDLNTGTYERTMVGDKKSVDKTSETDPSSSSTAVTTPRPAKSALRHKLMNGTVLEQDHMIKFEDVPLATPNGDVLIEKLNLDVPSGTNVLIAGPNGCGKSSLFRVLGGLWPLFGGTLVKPAKAHLFYIPQRPYLTPGTLRDQVIYPATVAEMAAKGVTDADLLSLLEEVHLGNLVDRPGGWNAICDWADVLSGGEKQRVAMARVFYHKPQFAILDECTSAVSVDVEGHMYRRCRELNITLFTVSHRKSLWRHHEKVLMMDGRGSYVFRDITTADLEGEAFGS